MALAHRIECQGDLSSSRSLLRKNADRLLIFAQQFRKSRLSIERNVCVFGGRELYDYELSERRISIGNFSNDGALFYCSDAVSRPIQRSA